MVKLSAREIMILDALTTSSTIAAASHYLIYTKNEPTLTNANIRMVLYRLRKKQKEARTYINSLLYYRQKSKLMKKLLTPKVPMKLDDDQNGFNVEMPKDTIISE